MLARIAIICALLLITVNAGADDSDIYKMMVGSNVMEVVQNRQLTFREDGDVERITLSPNGKYAVYLTIQPSTDSVDRIVRLYLIKLSGGKPILLIEGDKSDPPYHGSHQWKLPEQVHWSPDSKLIAIQAACKADGGVETGSSDDNQKTTPEMRDSFLFFNTAGSMVAEFSASQDSSLYSLHLHWNPDSRRVVTQSAGKRHPETNESERSVVVFDVISKQATTIFSKTSKAFMIADWIERGKAVLCVEKRESVGISTKIYLDGRAPEEHEEDPDFSGTSIHWLTRVLLGRIPYRYNKVEGGAEIVDTATDEALYTISGIEPYQIRHIPGSKFFRYTREQTIQDGPDGQKRKMISVWLTYPEGGKQNRMCIVLDGAYIHSISDDCLRYAYIKDKRAFITELELRKATPREKAAAGIRLTEEETKTLMLENACRIGDAIQESAWSAEAYPTQEDFLRIMEGRLGGRSDLLRPGTDQIAVTYFEPEDKHIFGNRLPPDTVLAVIDAGYGWQVKLFFDGRIQEAAK